MQSYLVDKLEEFNKEKIKLKILGKKNFAPSLNKLLLSAENKTKLNKKLQVNLALNYGSKFEILNALNLLKKKKKITIKDINNNLFTSKIPDPEILIRTGNTRRLSNFLLWQIAYSEIFFDKKLWPDFKAKDFNQILARFKKIKRNFGKI